jgi:6-phosphogluconolactonase
MIHVYPDAGAVYEAVADSFREAAHEAVAARGRFTVALTGGRLAHLWHQAIAGRLGIEWAKVDLFWGDERAVPPDHEDSNYRKAAALVEQGARVHRLPGEAADLEAAAAAYAKELPERLDLVHLGVGPDGHVCSLFSGHPLTRETTRRVAAVLDAPKPPPRRLTLTFAALHAAREIHGIVVGAEKADAMAQALGGPGGAPTPAAMVAHGPAPVVWFLDRAAAAKLKDKP